MIRLRPYKKNDAKGIISWNTTKEGFYEWSAGELRTFPATVEAMNEYFDSLSEDRTGYQVVAVEDRELMGYLVLHFMSEDMDDLAIESFWLSPSARERGHGSEVIQMVLKYAFDIMKAKRVLYYACEENSDMRALYRKVGFYETGVKNSYKVDGQTIAVIEMEICTDATGVNTEETGIPEDELIKDIIANNRLNYALQPIVDASSGEIFGYEALMRAGVGQSVSPVTILDYATRKNKLYDIEKLTIFNAMEVYVRNKEVLKDKKIFINSIPGYQLKKKDYTEFQNKYGGFFDNMVLEVTENTEFKDKELSVLLDRSSEDGFELAIDDYGTGYSNTSSLLSYLPRYLKIDRLLISDIHADSKKQHFVKSIVEFATSNGVKTLAEGVETSAELKMVIDLGVDLIQGYYTAKPSLDIIENIDEDIKAEIIASSVKGTNQEIRKVYTVEYEKELPVMRLALEKYTGILIGSEEFTLVGNTRYSAEMSIKIKDGTKCRLTLRNVYVESFQHIPCIEIGTGCDVTLVIEGENRLNKYGIMVPESSKLTIEGDGNLRFRCQGIASYAIGNTWSAKVGDIAWKCSGSLDILIEADEGIGIGGGEFGEDCGISLRSGIVRIEPASSKAVAVGSVTGEPRIDISDCKVQLDIKIEKGVGIGCYEGIQNTRIYKSHINILGAGSCISTIGSVEETGGKIVIDSSEVAILANGQQLYLIGGEGGDPDIDIDNSAIDLRAEGNNVVILGTKDLNANLQSRQSIINVKVASSSPILYGAKPECASLLGGLQRVSINE